MSTSDVVKQLVRQFDEGRLQQQAEQWAGAPMSVCRDVISTVKQIIKNKKELPATKLMALKVSPMQLFHMCMLKGNSDFLLFAAKKIMSRLTILASHKKSIRDSSRGEDIFGAVSVASDQNRKASADFLQCLLSYIRTWSQRFGRMQDGSPSPYALAYMKLTNFGIQFPPGEPPRASVQQRPDSVRSLPAVVLNEGVSRPLSRQEMEAKSNSAQLLLEMLDSPHPDSDTAAQLHSDLSAFLLRIERELNLKTGQVGLEDYITQLFELNDFVRAALEQYEKQKLNKLASGRLSLSKPPEELKSSPPVARGQSGPDLAAELEEKEVTLRSLQDELAKTKREAAAYLQSADFRRAQCEQARTQGEQELRALEERHAQELSARQLQPRGTARNRLLAANSQLADLREKLKDKDNEHRAILKALSSAQEENKRLKARLASSYSAPLGTEAMSANDFNAAPKSPEPVYSPQDFISQRASLASPGLAPGDRLDTEEVLLHAVDNMTFLRLALQIDKGLVYSDPFLEVGFMFKPPQVATMLLYIGNKGDMEIRQLKSFVYGVKIEGLELGINRETEMQPIAPKSKVNRTITVSRSGVFINVPRMHLSF